MLFHFRSSGGHFTHEYLMVRVLRTVRVLVPCKLCCNEGSQHRAGASSFSPISSNYYLVYFNHDQAQVRSRYKAKSTACEKKEASSNNYSISCHKSNVSSTALPETLIDSQSIQRNASKSPLLSLPGEIREKIFSLVVGNQFIHLCYLKGCGRFCHTVCTATASEDQVYEQFMSGHNPTPTHGLAGYDSFAFDNRHAHCTPWTFLGGQWFDDNAHEAEKSSQPMLSLSLLGACRQAYEEANFLLWTTNTFSFADSTTLKTFVNRLHSTQRKKLTRMHIDFGFHYFPELECQYALSLSLISQLKGLRTLHATIWQLQKSCVYHEVLPSLDRMQILPLQNVTVVVSDIIPLWGDGSTAATPPPDLWPITERQEVAERTRSKLLDPNGAEIQAAEMKEKQVLRERVRNDRD